MRILIVPTVRICCLLIAGWTGLPAARGADLVSSTSAVPSQSFAAALTPSQWKQVEDCVDRALAWIASSQAADGSFPSLEQAQPAVTALCVLAFLSRGHQPGFGPYGAQMDRAIDFVLKCQNPEDGLFDYEPPSDAGVFPGTGPLSQNPGQIAQIAQAVPQQGFGFGRGGGVGRNASSATYNHAISGLMLGEIFGHVSAQRTKEVKQAMEKALQFTHELQTRDKPEEDKGGWRYLRLQGINAADSDLSVTGWHLMFLRSARNAEFNVPQAYIDEALEFVHRCWVEEDGLFHYTTWGSQSAQYTRGLMGSAVVSLSLAGQHDSPQALAAGDWLLAHPYLAFGQKIGQGDRFYYSTYYCSQAAAQLGGRYWKGIFPPIAEILVRAQNADGSFPPDSTTQYGGFGRGRGGGNNEAQYGLDYTTSMAVLSLTPAYQLLPVYQR
jgi:prenyltransferase beta subunit